MGIKISSIELKDVEIIELENGEFEKRYINPKRYPAFLTNRALATGKRLGITKSSLFAEIVKLSDVIGDEDEINSDDLTPEQAEVIDADKYLPVIYLAVIGANKTLELSYEEFLDKYQGDIEEIVNDYMELVLPYLQQDPNEFKKGLEKSTSKK
ncbi:hypothetical protein [Pseudalkalibacillus caeni]|uniref:Uncharacterized protein n=1 Tax=Exobacillus caeni TaxID=2574798 RepID=A0A5R9F299_9BACL|nr:hypothetical protein [Pseudalkalibacillus caeni]TLS37737.1 hypothetical protein FCL54_07900 [Pseudalkalibacillus caeni]